MPAIEMLRKAKYVISLFVFFIISQSYGQKVKPLQKKVKELLAIDEYREALPLLLKLDSIIPLDAEINYLAGICYIQINDTKQAIRFLERAEVLNYNLPPLYYNMGRIYHSQHNFDRAISCFEKFKTNYNSQDEKGKNKIIEVDRFIINCKNGIELKKNPIKTTIYNLGPNINTTYPEYVPLIPADESFLMFSSKRLKQVAGANSYDEDIYLSVRDSSGFWSPSIKLQGEINTNGHEAGIALSSSGQKLYVYKDRGNGDIYLSELNNSRWSVPKRMPSTINSGYWEPSASISSMEDVIYFSSNRPGGFGGTDLYVSKKKDDGSWGEATNLGKEINTSLNEDAPFIHPDGKTLFFSSEGHNSMGGYDIFKTNLAFEGDNWSTPKNIGYPINTAGDDDFFVWSADGKRAYFSSVREGGYGDKDIYMAEMPQLTDNIILLKGKLLSNGDNISEKVVLTVTDLKQSRVISKLEFDNISGIYSVVLNQGGNYYVQAEARGYLPFSQNLEVADTASYSVITKDIYLEPLIEGSKTILRNVFFDSGKATLKKESYYELNNLAKILADNSTMYVEIAGHTDNVGNANENLKLSLDRAKSVKEYLRGQRIALERLIVIGYGEQFPIQTNDLESGRQANRRTEFIVIKKSSLKDYKGFYFQK